MKLDKRQKNHLLIGLCAVVLIMAVGYAAFAQRLNINGTANVTSTWNVLITDIKEKAKSGGNSASAPTHTNTTATFSSTLTKPGDYITYEVTVENQGTIDAILKTITKTDANNNAIVFTVDGIAENDALNAGATTTFTVKVEYSNSVTTQPSVLTSTLTLQLDYEQNKGNTEPLTPQSGGSNLIQSAGVVTTGEGLYQDETEQGRYVYRGANPNNYITFNGETAGWRIVSVETDGTIKIVRNNNLVSMAWDLSGKRKSTTSTYCTNGSTRGCNAWAATSNLVGTPSEFTLYSPNGNPSTDTTTYSGTVTADASLNTFLNNDYYNNTEGNSSYLGTDKSYIVSHNFYVGAPGSESDQESIATDYQQEKSYVWNGKIGLIQATDYLKASTDAACNSLSAAYNKPYPCGNGNYLKPSNSYWTISPVVYYVRAGVWHVINPGISRSNNAGNPDGVRPAVYLSSGVNIKGEGTSGSPYYIDN